MNNSTSMKGIVCESDVTYDKNKAFTYVNLQNGNENELNIPGDKIFEKEVQGNFNETINQQNKKENQVSTTNSIGRIQIEPDYYLESDPEDDLQDPEVKDLRVQRSPKRKGCGRPIKNISTKLKEFNSFLLRQIAKLAHQQIRVEKYTKIDQLQLELSKFDPYIVQQTLLNLLQVERDDSKSKKQRDRETAYRYQYKIILQKIRAKRIVQRMKPIS